MSYDHTYNFGPDDDEIVVADGTAQVFAGAGDDTILAYDSLDGDSFDGGDGFDQLHIRGSATDIDLNNVDLFSIEEIRIQTFDRDTGSAVSRRVVLSDEVFDGVSWRPNINVFDGLGAELIGTGMSSSREMSILLNAGDSLVTLGGTQDYIRAGAGNDTIDAGAGLDYLQFKVGDYTVSETSGQTLSLTQNSGASIPTWDVFFAGEHVLTITQPDASVQQLRVVDARDLTVIDSWEQFGDKLVSNAEKFYFDMDILPASGTGDSTRVGLGYVTVDFSQGIPWLALSDLRTYGSDGDETINGTGGDDRIIAFRGADFIDAGAGDDTIEVYDNAATDTIRGGDGEDRLFLKDASSAITLGANITGIEEVIIDTREGDTLRQVTINESVISDIQSWGFRVSAYGSADVNFDATALTTGVSFLAGDGDNLIKAGSGDDWLTAWRGDDTIDGGAGFDTLDLYLGRVEVGNELDGLTLTQRESDGAWILGTSNDDWFLIERAPEPYNENQIRITDLRGADLLLPDGVNHGTDIISNVEQIVVQYSFFDENGQSVWNRWADIDISLTVEDGLQLSVSGLSGTPGDDTLIGTDGYDFFNAMTGQDLVLLGGGNDQLVIMDNGAGDTLDGGWGFDEFTFEGVSGEIRLGDGISGFEQITVKQDYSSDQGTTVVLENGMFSGVISAPAVEFWGSAGVTIDAGGVDLADLPPTATVSSYSEDLYLGGDEGDDTIIGSALDDLISPGSGNDTVDGGFGQDAVTFNLMDWAGLSSFSQISLEKVSDSNWNVRVNNQAWVNLSAVSDGSIVVDDVRVGASHDAGTKTIRNIEALVITGDGADPSFGARAGVELNILNHGSSTFDLEFSYDGLLLIGGPNNDSIQGGSGPEAIAGSDGNDTLIGGGGDDTLDGGPGNDYLRGGDQNDYMLGGTGSDYNVGSFGNDTIIGYFGYDTVSYRELQDDLNAGLTIDFGQGIVNYVDATDSTKSFTDELVSIETLYATNRADTIDSSDYGLVGMGNVRGGFGLWQAIYPGQGNDSITGNGSTLLRFWDNNNDSGDGVHVDLAAGLVRSVQSGSPTDTGYFGRKVIEGGVNAIEGTEFNDYFRGDPRNTWFEAVRATPGSDTIDGGSGYDRVEYDRRAVSDGGLTIALNDGQGIVTGKYEGAFDTLRGIEAVRGTWHNDVFLFDQSLSGSSSERVSYQAEGGAGNDTITGNGVTTVRFSTAWAGVYANLDEGVSHSLEFGSDANVGVDEFSGVNGIIGSNHADHLIGSDSAAGYEIFRGAGGDDTIDGGAGWDIAQYNAGGNFSFYDGDILRGVGDDGEPSYQTGIRVHLADGIVIGDPLVEGTDTLRSIEDVRGTVNNDWFDARGFGSESVNAGSSGTRNSFRGGLGDDTIIGNGDTRADYRDAADGVYVDLVQGVAQSRNNSAGDPAQIGVDRLYGVNIVLGSEFGDYIVGGEIGEFGAGLLGYGGNDTLIGGSNWSVFEGGAGDDSIVAGNRGSVARYNGDFEDFSIEVQGGKLLVSDLREGNPEGSDVLENLNVLRFDDSDHFVLGLANRTVLTGNNPSYNIGNSDMIVGTAYAEQFNTTDDASPFIFAGDDDTIRLAMAIDEYVVRAFGTQLHLTEVNGNNTVFVNVGGDITVSSTTGDASVSFDFANKRMLFGDRVVDNNGFDEFAALERYTVDPLDSQWFSATGLVEIPEFAAGQGGDVIEYAYGPLVIGGTDAAADGGRARIDQATGIATFATGSGDTLDDALADIASSLAEQGDAEGNLALFKIGGSGDYHLFISDGQAGVTESDIVLQLGGVGLTAGVDVSSGDLMLLDGSVAV